jgi:hypothetical protein
MMIFALLLLLPLSASAYVVKNSAQIRLITLMSVNEKNKSAHHDRSNHIWMQCAEVWIFACFCE